MRESSSKCLCTYALATCANLALLHVCMVSSASAQASQAATASSVRTEQVQSPTPVVSYDGQPEYVDPAGAYAGFTVCADCSGISVRLLLKDDPSTQDHGSYRQVMMYLDAPTHSHYGRTSKDQTAVENGSWKIAPASPGGTDRQLCLTPKTAGHDQRAPECYHVVHQTVLVDVNGFETDHQPDPFPAGLKTLLKQRRLSDGHEYPMLPVDDWSGFSVTDGASVR